MQLSYTIEEACAISSIGRTKLYEAISNGQLSAKKFGKKTLILREDLLKFLENLQNYPASIKN